MKDEMFLPYLPSSWKKSIQGLNSHFLSNLSDSSPPCLFCPSHVSRLAGSCGSSVFFSEMEWV